MTISNNQQQSATISNNQQQSATISNNQQQYELTTAHNADYTTNKLAQLKQILPEVFCDGVLDIDKLKQVLGQSISTDKERYGLSWVGKDAAYRTLQTPSHHTLAPSYDDSVDFETTDNLFIESDNLEALKLLQKSYAGQVKMIYIDPPYNTGNDFIYNDNYRSDKKTYQQQTGELDDDGNRLGEGLFKNSKDGGHYHSNWLSMMLPRLHLARTLLSDDGVIFISIDDNEQAQLKLLCDEVFGAYRFVGTIGWEAKTKSQNTKTSYNKLQPKIEYILVYSMQEKARFNLIEIGKKNYPLKDEKGEYRIHQIETMNATGIRGRNTMIFSILGVDPPAGKQWQIGKDTVENFESRGDLFLDNNKPCVKMRLCDERNEITEPFWAFFDKTIGTAESAKSEFNGIIRNHGFETVKPTDLVKKLAMHATDKNSIILDFFAGSSTTAHAVMQLNAEDGGNRKFMMVQLPEATDKKSESYKAGYATIAEISKERIRRAGAKIKEQNPNVDTGFKVFKLTDSNFKQWQSPKDDIKEQLALFVDNVAKGANDDAIVYEITLRLGLPLTTDISHKDGAYWLPNGSGYYALIIQPLGDFNAVINQRPIKIVALDKTFKNDVQKSNAVLQCQDAGIELLTI